ncbi:MAG: pyrroloquinoline quinone biosynthesis protein PqqE [Pseudomonadota bacterium]|nr:pyrroloquinoline quinone biosynthesis protein PqqE [Pseudomonadota bacterium]
MPVSASVSAPLAPAVSPPLWLLAELTYRCPLHCVFCYNPTQYARLQTEMSTAQWVDVMRQARALGAAQLGFSGGEPMLRDDLEELVQEAHHLGFYTNLITSGVGFTPARAQKLKDAGLDHVQLSFQDSTKELNDFLSHTKTFDLKLKVAKLIKEHDWPMVMNCVLHRHNLPHVDKIIEMAEALGAEFLELANTQYYGWAWTNRDQLMPTQEQLLEAEAVVKRYREQPNPACRVLFVVPDYFEERPKACMNGWGSVFLAIAPDGTALPCHNARDLPGLNLPRVQDQSLADIWARSQAFNIYRGQDWMKPPCRDCDERHKDFGGCRCQAFLVTGDATQADPVCSKSPHHEKIVELVRRAPEHRVVPIVFRSDSESRRLHPQK